MKRIFYFLICAATLTSSCRREGHSAMLVHERLHGKYKVISSITSEAVDVNSDGTASTDLRSEIDYGEFCELVILIPNKDVFLFSQMWPEQFISYGNPPVPVVNYACQGTGRLFSIAGDNTTLLLKPDEMPLPDNLWTFPTSVTIKGKDLIEVVFTKKLFTTAGWQTVTITTIYERFTMNT